MSPVSVCKGQPLYGVERQGLHHFSFASLHLNNVAVSLTVLSWSEGHKNLGRSEIEAIVSSGKRLRRAKPLTAVDNKPVSGSPKIQDWDTPEI